MVDRPQVKVTELKRDALGAVELLQRGQECAVRRVASGGRIPGSGWVARVLLRRERRALDALSGLPAVPALLTDPGLASEPSTDGRAPASKSVLLRTYLMGEPLHRATRLPQDFFDHLDRLVESLHESGVCHNDLHKEQNVVVTERGWPALIDFQLASVHHRRDSRTFRVRCAEDLRHVQKHRRRYTRDGRGPESASASHGAAYGARRSFVARTWRRFGKPVYIALTRGILRRRDGEERRPSTGPWPAWGAPLGGPQQGPGKPD